MKELVPYISYAGNCEEALNFYKEAMGGEIRSIMKWSDGPPEYQDEENKDKIMHSEFAAGKFMFMAADDSKGDSGNSESRIKLSMNFDSEEEQSKVFNALSSGGEVTMPLQDTFWGARFGMLTDKFGVSWMFNFDKQAG